MLRLWRNNKIACNSYSLLEALERRTSCTFLSLFFIVGKTKQPNFAQPHRRLVCRCTLFEVTYNNTRKKAAPTFLRRYLFLFNDLLVVTKKASKASISSRAPYKQTYSVSLRGLRVALFHTPEISLGIQIIRLVDGAELLTLNAGSENDRFQFVSDLQESIMETKQTEETAHVWTLNLFQTLIHWNVEIKDKFYPTLKLEKKPRISHDLKFHPNAS